MHFSRYHIRCCKEFSVSQNAYAVVAGTMFNIFLLIAAVRMISRRCSSERVSEPGPDQMQAPADVESARLKQLSPTVVLHPDNQACFKPSS